MRTNHRMQKIFDTVESSTEAVDESKQNESPPMPRISMRSSYLSKFWGWFTNMVMNFASLLPTWVVDKDSLRAMILWVSGMPLDLWSFLKAITSKRVDDETYRQRMAACKHCTICSIELSRKKGITKLAAMFCGSCRCPKWPFANLVRKNRLSGWHCPDKKHPGPYPDDAVSAFIEVSYAKNETCDCNPSDNGNGTDAVGSSRKVGCGHA